MKKIPKENHKWKGLKKDIKNKIISIYIKKYKSHANNSGFTQNSIEILYQ